MAVVNKFVIFSACINWFKLLTLEVELYKSELIRDMKLMGCTKISDLHRNNLRFRR